MNYEREVEVVHDIVMYWFNVDASELFDDLYGQDHHPDYKKEKVEMIRRGVGHLWIILDKPHRERLVIAARQRSFNMKYPKEVQ